MGHKQETLKQMTKNALIRPAWTPVMTVSMVVGFMMYWPIGLAILGYILWGNRFEGFTREVNRVTDDFVASCKRGAHAGTVRTGNAAFDDWRDAEIERLNEERRKLESMKDEFDTYVRELRRAKDREEFDRFMHDRKAAPHAPGVTINA